MNAGAGILEEITATPDHSSITGTVGSAGLAGKRNRYMVRGGGSPGNLFGHNAEDPEALGCQIGPDDLTIRV